MRPVLRPGLQILRRDLRTLQLGHDWPGLAVVADNSAVQAVLSAVDGFRDVDGVVLAAAAGSALDRAQCEAALALLVEAGALVDRPRTEHTGPAPQTRAASAALWLLGGPERGGDTLAVERAACRVWVAAADDSDEQRQIASAARGLVTLAGLAAADAQSCADVVIVTSDAIPDRARPDSLMHEAVPHLWVHLRDLVAVIGPMVVPGQSACLRCTDAARAERDPTWPAVISSALARPRVAIPCDPVTAIMVAAWAVQEVAIWASGLTPSTTDAIIEVPPGLGPAVTHSYAMHPHCGCGWQTWQDTMGA